MAEEIAELSVKKQRVIIALKFAGAALLLWLLFQQIDAGDIWQQAMAIPPHMLLLAFVCFTVAQIASTLRMNYYYRCVDKPLNFRFSLILYYVGLVYNVILPGGIGGDAYKVYLLKKKADFPVGEGVRIQLSNRFNGLLVLCWTLLATLFFMPFKIDALAITTTAVVALLMGTLAYFFFAHLVLKESIQTTLGAIGYSILVQGFTVMSMLVLWWSMSDGQFMAEYILLFQLASIAGMIPVTVGGLGIREFTFFYGAELINRFTHSELDPGLGVTISLLMFAMTVVSACLGLPFLHSVSKMNPCQTKA